MSNGWNKGYKMGDYKYAYGAYKTTTYHGGISEEDRKDMKENIAYWKAYYYEKYQGKF